MFLKTKLMVCLALVGLLLTVTLAPLAAQQAASPLAEDGAYKIGVQILNLTDETRDNRALQAFIWYPAIVEKGAKRPYPPDASGAPYPLIIYSHGYNGSPGEAISVFIEHLVSQGYVVAAVDHKDTNDAGHALVNRPLDVLFLLNQLAALKDDNSLKGLIDTDHVGLIGYSAGTYTSLVAGGARIDPTSFPDWCAASDAEPDICNFILPTHAGMIAYHDQLLPASDDNLWAATTDERIRAVAMIAPCFAHLIGGAGIADVAVPTILFGATLDAVCPFDVNAAYYYQTLATADHYLVTLEKRTHGTVLEGRVIKPYVSAFFGEYVLGKTDYAQYLTPDTANNFRNVTLEATLEEQ